MKKATEQATVRRSRFFCTIPLPPKAPDPPNVVDRPASFPEWRKTRSSTAKPRMVSSATSKYFTSIYRSMTDFALFESNRRLSCRLRYHRTNAFAYAFFLYIPAECASRHLRRRVQTEKTKQGGSYIGQAGAGPQKRFAAHYDQGDQAGAMRCVDGAVHFQHGLCVPVIPRHYSSRPHPRKCPENPAQAAVHVLDGLHRRRYITRVTDHVGVGEVEYHQVERVLSHRFIETVGDFVDTHGRLLVVCR